MRWEEAHLPLLLRARSQRTLQVVFIRGYTYPLCWQCAWYTPNDIPYPSSRTYVSFRAEDSRVRWLSIAICHLRELTALQSQRNLNVGAIYSGFGMEVRSSTIEAAIVTLTDLVWRRTGLVQWRAANLVRQSRPLTGITPRP